MADSTQSSQHSDKPKPYILGWVEFYKLKFKVTPAVLIPRPESELLVDEVLNLILRPNEVSGEATLKTMINNKEGSRLRSNNKSIILDIGTGSGNLDISEDALDVARENARLNRVEKRIFFIQSDLLDSIDPSGLQNDNSVIVTNLPYIPRTRISYLDPSVRDFEPIIALDGGSDGFDLYRELFQQIKHKFLRKSAGVNTNPPPGWTLKLVVCEIDYTHEELTVNAAQKYFPEAKVEVKTDLAKNIRILKILFSPW